MERIPIDTNMRRISRESRKPPVCPCNGETRLATSEPPTDEQIDQMADELEASWKESLKGQGSPFDEFVQPAKSPKTGTTGDPGYANDDHPTDYGGLD